MTLSNLPPGCRESDIPGNRPEDIAAEALCDKIAEIIDPFGLGIEQAGMIVDAVFQLCSDVYGEAYAKGQDDARLAALETDPEA